MFRVYLAAGLLVWALLAVACGGSAPDASATSDRVALGQEGALAAQPPLARPKAGLPSLASEVEGQPAVGERLIVRSGQISLVVADLDVAVQAVVSLAPEIGGFVVSSNRSGERESAFAQVTIRVPADRFDQALERLRRLGQRVEAESTSSQDVTEEFVDLQARLRNLEATERQLVALLDRATTVEDVLKVHRELTTIRSEIERLQGRIQYLERSAALSLLTVSLRPTSSPEPLVNPRWSFVETVREAVRDLVEGTQGVATLGIRLVIFAPLWLPPALVLGGALWVVWRWRRARRQRQTTPGTA